VIADGCHSGLRKRRVEGPSTGRNDDDATSSRGTETSDGLLKLFSALFATIGSFVLRNDRSWFVWR
jgi:hypothetical protein